MFKLETLQNMHINTKNSGIVYCAYNTINAKVYIGFTNMGLRLRRKSHTGKALKCFDNKTNNYFVNALKKYKKEKFNWFILYTSDQIEDLLKMEKYYINYFDSNNRLFGYNMTTGGDHCKFNEEIKKKISDKAKIRLANKENNGMFGKSLYSVWLTKYGKDEADKKQAELNKKRSINAKGKNNSMFGKPSQYKGKKYKTKKILLEE